MIEKPLFACELCSHPHPCWHEETGEMALTVEPVQLDMFDAELGEDSEARAAGCVDAHGERLQVGDRVRVLLLRGRRPIADGRLGVVTLIGETADAWAGATEGRGWSIEVRITEGREPLGPKSANPIYLGSIDVELLDRRLGLGEELGE